MSKDVSSMVKTFLETTNRPFSANDVFNQLNTNDNKQSKTAITRALEELAANELIVEKVNGKQKIYFADQNNIQDMDQIQRQQMCQHLDQLESESKEVEKEIKVKESKLSSLKTSLTSEQLNQQLIQLKKEINELENKLQSIDSKGKDFNPEENQKIKEKHNSVVKEWSKRKRMATDMLSIIEEASNKKKKLLIEEIGVETDEEFGVTLPQK